ncbi:MAG: bifunctional glutamate N-acetyltransferase/amino-acid acetyltransferase ArgJ [Fimbriimonadaceae bacterium]|nr:bifunctional glutamate N-acetyltransferase/amino-acid acetyltransferase ArgJ [Fimbriimonadaceae bacterium]
MAKGFLYGGVRCGLKNKRRDVGVIYSEVPATSAGVFTRNVVRAACVDFSRRSVEGGVLRAIAVNSGNANCCTGVQGEVDCARTAEIAADALDVPAGQVAVASTGVIGQPLDMTKLERGVREACVHLQGDPSPFMEAILTTDLVEKQASAILGGGTIRGFAKGSGMIEPNMATLLGFIVTDLIVEREDLQRALREANEASFNCLTVDGDTSTNDMLFLMANGASGHRPTYPEFAHALATVCTDLARQVARDGEGATKLLEIVVRGTEDPRRVAKTIANSPLVKTAMFGCDPNWGRVLAAAGRSGVPFDPALVRLALIANDERHELFCRGEPTGFDPARVSADLKDDTVRIEFDAPGELEATVYTCDFGYGYVRINAEYHT